MFSNIGVPGLILILIVALVVFGPSKLPEIGRAFGRSLREFKDATNNLTSDERTSRSDDKAQEKDPAKLRDADGQKTEEKVEQK